LWDEENRLEAVAENGYVSNYWYDAAGERTVKTSGEGEGMYVLGVFSGGRTQTADFTLYVNPYLVVGKGGRYTKHIYIGSQRIVSKLGDLGSFGADPRRVEYAGANTDVATIDYKAKYATEQAIIKARYDTLKVPYNGKSNDDYVNGKGFCCDDAGSQNGGTTTSGGGGNITNGNDNPEINQYYYHSDHLGSSSFITNLDGEVAQHIEYVPFGEVFIEEKNNNWNTPYKFNGKQLDEETGFYYYGARYYDGRTSLWLSVDPLADYNPAMSSEYYGAGQHNGGVYNPKNGTVYGYCYQNPICYIDPNGKQVKVTSMNFDNMMSNYDRDGEGILNREKSLNYLANKKTNTCAIKLSNAFNKSGYHVPLSSKVSDNVRIQNGKGKGSENFVLDAASMANYLKEIQDPTETYTIKTPEGVDKMIQDIHKKYDDMKGVIVYEVDNIKAYGATGHADLIYEDWGWDLAFSSGTEVAPYLKDHVLPKTTFKVYLWILDYDKKK
jgi:RHS repeat-associated protein